MGGPASAPVSSPAEAARPPSRSRRRPSSTTERVKWKNRPGACRRVQSESFTDALRVKTATVLLLILPPDVKAPACIAAAASARNTVRFVASISGQAAVNMSAASSAAAATATAHERLSHAICYRVDERSYILPWHGGGLGHGMIDLLALDPTGICRGLITRRARYGTRNGPRSMRPSIGCRSSKHDTTAVLEKQTETVRSRQIYHCQFSTAIAVCCFQLTDTKTEVK